MTVQLPERPPAEPKRPSADRGFLCPCPTPKLCKPEPRTCWKR